MKRLIGEEGVGVLVQQLAKEWAPGAPGCGNQNLPGAECGFPGLHLQLLSILASNKGVDNFASHIGRSLRKNLALLIGTEDRGCIIRSERPLEK